MNVRKPVDYSAMFAALDSLMAADLPQMELYYEIGRLVSARPEKGAAVSAAEYLASTYPDASGFSPRNLRRMRDFYRTYENTPEVLARVMTIGWTQNIVILEAELTHRNRHGIFRPFVSSGGPSWNCSIRSPLMFTWIMPSTLRTKYAILRKRTPAWSVPQMTKILFVCHGNICRSPMAEFVMKDLVKQAGLEDQFQIASAATSTEEISCSVYPPARRKLAEHGISCAGKTARQLTKGDYAQYDLLIGMDRANIRNMNRICGGDPDGKIKLLLDYTDHPGDVADPWYTGDFDATWRDVLEGCQGLLRSITER